MEFVINTLGAVATWLAKLIGFPSMDFLILVLLISIAGGLVVGIIIKLFGQIKNPLTRMKSFIVLGWIIANIGSIYAVMNRVAPHFGYGDVIAILILNGMFAGFYLVIRKGKDKFIEDIETKSSDKK